MMKSCVINHHIYHIKMFCSTPKSWWYGHEHRSNKQKSQKKFKNKNNLKKHTVKKHTNIKNTFQKINHNVIPSNKKHDKHWVIFTRYFLGMQNIVSYKKHHQNQENAFMPKQQKIYTSQVMYTWFASASKIAVWFVISKESLYQIFAWYLH